MAFFAPGYDVVAKAWRLRSERMETPKAVYLRPFLVMRLLAELLTVPKNVMVCCVCMVFLLFARSIGTHPKGKRKVRCSQIVVQPLPREEVFGKGPEACEGEESETRRARHASS